MAAPVNLVVKAVISTYLFIVLYDRNLPTILGLGAPDQGADPRGPIGGDQLTFFPLISLPSFSFISFTFVHFITY